MTLILLLHYSACSVVTKVKILQVLSFYNLEYDQNSFDHIPG